MICFASSLGCNSRCPCEGEQPKCHCWIQRFLKATKNPKEISVVNWKRSSPGCMNWELILFFCEKSSRKIPDPDRRQFWVESIFRLKPVLVRICLFSFPGTGSPKWLARDPSEKATVKTLEMPIPGFSGFHPLNFQSMFHPNISYVKAWP